MNPTNEPVSLRRLFLFFIPMGFSALLINLSHVIINGTLARVADPDRQQIVLAGYAIAMSLLVVSERPAVLLRQTCSALVRDKASFRAVGRVAIFVFGGALAFGGLVAYSPVGHWIFGLAFGSDRAVETEAIQCYYALMFLSVFSGLRCYYQGVIIYKMKTRWLTIGMAFRLAGMFLLSQYYLHVGVTNAFQGSVIFLFGMIIEAAVSWMEARKLVREFPEKDEACVTTKPRHVLRFYNPLLYSSLIVVWAMPILNAVLGLTDEGTLAIASFALAGSLMNLMLGFFTYFHQISLLFFKTDPQLVRKFTLLLGFTPTLLLGVMSFTPVGTWMFSRVLGVEDELLDASVHALRGYIPFVLAFPWLDTLNGIVMAHGETKMMFRSQLSNAAVATALVVLLAFALPSWHGALGSLAQSGGMFAELVILTWLFRRSRRSSSDDSTLLGGARA